MTDDERRALSAWAEGYYPARATPCPPLSGWFSPAELIALFERTRSRAGHLALIDQAPIRNAVEALRKVPEGEPVLAAVRASWQRTG